VDTVVEPLGAGFAANHDEDSGSGLAFRRACTGVFKRKGLQAAVAVSLDDPRAQVDLHVGIALSCVIRYSDMPAVRDSPRTSRCTRAGYLVRYRAV